MADKLWFFYALGAAIVWGLGYVLSQKLLQQYEMSTTFLIFMCCLLALPLYFTLSFAMGDFQDGMDLLRRDWRAFALVCIISVTVVGGNYLITNSIVEKNAALASLVEITYPLFTLLFAYLILKEVQVNLYTGIGSLMILCGVGLIYLKS